MGRVELGGLRWFSRCGPFTRIGHIPGGGAATFAGGWPDQLPAKAFSIFPRESLEASRSSFTKHAMLDLFLDYLERFNPGEYSS